MEYNIEPRAFSETAMIRMLQFLRKILVVIDGFSEDFKQYALRTVLQQCLRTLTQIVHRAGAVIF
jgi:hypothetical protein